MPDIALVVLDTLRKESFDRHFDWLPGLRFEQAWSTSGWTVPVHGSLFTGRYPSETGIYAKVEHLDYEPPVLAERLADHGYTTRAFSGNAYVSPSFDFDRGFDVFETNWRGRRRDEEIFDWGNFISETQDEGPTRFLRAIYECVSGDVDTTDSLKIGLRTKARDLGLSMFTTEDDGAREALEFVRSTSFGDDEFLFLNLMEAHSPYVAPSDYRTVDIDESPGLRATVSDGPDTAASTIEQAYEDCVQYLSDVYRDIFAELAASFDYVITLGDHGESFGTNGIWSHCYGINPELTHVPLCIYRGSDEQKTSDATVGLLDVHRTLLDLVDLPTDGARGRNLLSNPDSKPQLIERHGLTGSHVENLESFGVESNEVERWDKKLRGIALPDGGYAWESRSGLERWRTDNQCDNLYDRIESLTEDLDEREITDSEDTDLDEDVKQRLETLGYA